MKMNLYYANICKHEKNVTSLWCKIMINISVEQTKRNEGSYFYLYLFGDLAQGSSKEASMCALNKKTF